MKIIDCFTFYNELDLLKYRLNILNETVDYFVIVEATHTFSGNPKKLFFDESLFEEFKHKIIHVIVNDLPYIYPNISFGNMATGGQWINEYTQRNAIDNGFTQINLDDQDIIVIADLDEIPDPSTLLKIKNNEIPVEINSLEMDLYYYNLNSQMGKWNCCKVISYKNYKELNKTCSQIRLSDHPSIPLGGWHLSYFGNSAFIKNKIESFSHQEFNNNMFTDLSTIDTHLNNGSDLYNRNIEILNISISDNKYLPPEYNKYLTNFIRSPLL